jgi:hypothetical protein
VAQGELTRRAEGRQVEPAGRESRVLARALQGPGAALGERVQAQALEDLEGHALGHPSASH